MARKLRASSRQRNVVVNTDNDGDSKITYSRKSVNTAVKKTNITKKVVDNCKDLTYYTFYASTKKHNRKRNIDPIPLWDSVCLVFSSTFFLIPAYFSYIQSNMICDILALLSVCTALVSMNYWRNSVHGWRLFMDHIFSRVSCTAYLCTFLYELPPLKPVIMALVVVNMLLIGFSYFYSCYLWENDYPQWVYIHMIFHLLGSTGEILVVVASYDTDRLQQITNWLHSQ